MATIIGIDPGSPLTIGVLKDGVPLAVFGYEQVAVRIIRNGRKSATWLNQASLVADIIRTIQADHGIDMVIIEGVTIRPGESLSSGQKFVGSMYLAEGICAGLCIPYKLAYPSVWKRQSKIPVTLKNPKEPSRLRAIETWPKSAALFSRMMDHDRAEALLMANWWRLHGDSAQQGKVA
jgi:hypothetical protein